MGWAGGCGRADCEEHYGWSGMVDTVIWVDVEKWIPYMLSGNTS